MALLVTLFLVLVNIFNSVTANAPKAEGLTAVETWVGWLVFICIWSRQEVPHCHALYTVYVFTCYYTLVFQESILREV